MIKNNTQKCSACGTSPINHHLLFISNLLEETIGELIDKLLNLNKSNKIKKLTNVVEKILLNTSTYIGIMSFKNDKEKALTGRSKLIWEEAERRSILMEQVIVFGKPIESYRARVNGKMIYFTSLPIPPSLKQEGYLWLDDKYKLFEILSKNNIPIAKTEKIFTWKSAEKAFNKLEKPVIIKPKNGSRGRHTTTNIKNEEELKNALKIAGEITLWTVMQEHLTGSVCRATVINNELVGFFKALPPQITGDGNKNIEELIKEKNINRGERLSEIIINEDLIQFIERQNYTLKDILEKDKTINLSAKTGRMYGGHTEEMFPNVHPRMHQIFKKAGELVEAPVVGFDLIIENPDQDPDTQKWGIIECNSLPFIDLHYFAEKGEPINLAKNVWDLWK